MAATGGNQEARHSNVERANEITLQPLRSGASTGQEDAQQSAAAVRAALGEEEHLLGDAQRQPAAAKQAINEQQQLLQDYDDNVDDGAASAGDGSCDAVRTVDAVVNVANYGAAVVDAAATANVRQQREAPALQLLQTSGQITKHDNAATMQTHSQLDMQKVSGKAPDYGDSNESGTNNNATTIILAPTSLNAATATPTKSPTAAAAPGGGDGPDNGQQQQHHLPFHSHLHYKGPKPWRLLVRHWPEISQPLAICAVFVGLWIIAYVLLPQYAVPSTPIMRIFFLFAGAQLAGVLVTFLRLPDMLGMLFFGVLYTNVGLADFTGYAGLEAFLREMALINIMLLAGLGLDANAFKKLWLMILRLTLVPTIVEVTVIAVLARFTLSMPWMWGVLLGLVITAVSPNVVVTVMLKLKEERLGLNSGIHTLIYAMTSCNDVVAIFMFGVILSVIFSTDKSLTEQILQGPIGIGIGIVFGYIYGLMLTILPSPKTTYLNGLRFVLTILGGTIAVMGSKAIGYPSAGALGCMTIALFAGIGWKRQQKKLTPQQRQRQHANENASVPARLDLLWKFLKPVSFALIGKEINFAVLDGKVVGYGLLLVLLGSLFRLAFAYISTYGGDLSRSERAYITISGLPKATVQAALGPIALDLARSLNDAEPQQLSLANEVLVISVLAIIFTAPLGAVLMLRLAPRWLKRSECRSHSSTDDAANVVENGFNTGGELTNSPKFTPNLSQRGVTVQNALSEPTPPRAGVGIGAAATPTAVAANAAYGAGDVLDVDGSTAQTKAARHLV